MGIANIINSSNASSGGEIVRELVNSSDGQGLHFDGSGVVAFTPVDLGSKFSHEFVISTSEDLTTGTSSYIVDYHGSSDRFIIGFNPSEDSGNLAIFDNTGWESFGVNPLTDLKVHHIVVTVDGTSAVLYDNGNQVATATISDSHGIDSTTNAGLAGYYNNSNQFEGTIYRARVYNRTLSADDVRTSFERSDVPVADQYGSQTELIQNGTDWTGASGTTPPSYWTVGNVATFTIDSTSGSGDEPALQIEKNGANPSMYQTQTVEVGKQYRVTYRVKNNNATNVTVRIGSTANGSEYNSLVVSSTSWSTVTRDVTATTTTLSVGVEVTTSTASQSGYIDSVSVVQTGVVQDLDLAFANPTQSLTVQDRSTNNVDGTASSSTAVKQVQRIVQLNSTSARIGTTQAIPADGELLVSGNLGVGCDPSRELEVSGSGNVYARITAQTANDSTALELKNTGGTWTIVNDDTASEALKFKNGGSASDVRLTIDSSGLATFTRDGGSVIIADRTSSDGDVIGIKKDDVTRLRIGTDGITFANGAGAAPTAAANNQLDYYGEGTFTPTVRGSTTAGSYSISTAIGRYTRIGNVVTVNVSLINITQVTAGSGNLEVGGLPFQSIASSTQGFIGSTRFRRRGCIDFR